MRVLFVANVSDLYGASRSLLRLAQRLVADGHRVEVILPEEGPLRSRLQQAGADTLVRPHLAILRQRTLRSPAGWLRLLAHTAVSAIELARHIRATRPDLVHTNSAVLPAPGLAARLCGVPHLWHVREFLRGASRLWPLYQWYMALLSDRLLCISEAVSRQFHPFLRRGKALVVDNGIPDAEFRPPERAEVEERRRSFGLGPGPLIGMAGRIHLEQKGQDVFARAARRLADQFPEAGFVIAGSPFPGNEEHEQRLRRLIQELGLQERVALTGDVAAMAATYAAVDVWVLPARKPEGLGNVLIEAMALGKPVVGSAVGGIPEIIVDGVNGYLAPPDDPAALAEALAPLVRDPELRRRMGEAGRRRFLQCFEFEACYESVLHAYRPALERAALTAGRPFSARVHPESGHGVMIQSRTILGMRVDGTSYEDAARRVAGWARAGESRYVAVATVNNVMESYDSPEFRRIMNEAGLVTPDGMPLVWGLRLLGVRGASRVYGPDLTPALLRAAERDGLPVGFYGATPVVLARLQAEVRRRFPRIRIAWACAPPFRPLTKAEDEEVVRELNRSGVRILFVGLSTPKQERWMAAHQGRVPAVMIGVGAAFDFLAGVKPQAPRWLQNCGLEWLFRLACEPRRLWRRYWRHNPRFALLFTRQLLGQRGS